MAANREAKWELKDEQNNQLLDAISHTAILFRCLGRFLGRLKTDFLEAESQAENLLVPRNAQAEYQQFLNAQALILWDKLYPDSCWRVETMSNSFDYDLMLRLKHYQPNLMFIFATCSDQPVVDKFSLFVALKWDPSTINIIPIHHEIGERSYVEMAAFEQQAEEVNWVLEQYELGTLEELLSLCSEFAEVFIKRVDLDLSKKLR